MIGLGLLDLGYILVYFKMCTLMFIWIESGNEWV